MGQVTNSNVFDFMGTPADVRTTQGTPVTDLIAKTIKDIEAKIGRRIEKETVTDALFEDGLNCSIAEDMMFLKGKFRDLYTITSITENGVALTAVSDSNDGNDYYLDPRLGIIKRVNQSWSHLPSAIKITGDLGLVEGCGGPHDQSARGHE